MHFMILICRAVDLLFHVGIVLGLLSCHNVQRLRYQLSICNGASVQVIAHRVVPFSRRFTVRVPVRLTNGNIVRLSMRVRMGVLHVFVMLVKEDHFDIFRSLQSFDNKLSKALPKRKHFLVAVLKADLLVLAGNI